MENNTIKKAIDLAHDLDEGFSIDVLETIKFVDVNSEDYDDKTIPDEVYNTYNSNHSNQLNGGNFLFVISMCVLYCFIDNVTKENVLNYLAQSN